MDSRARNELAERLHEKIVVQAERFASEADANGLGAEPSSIPKLRDLQWLVDALRVEKSVSKHWPIMLIFCLTALCISILLDAPRHVSVVATATTSEVSFDYANSGNLSRDFQLIPNEIEIQNLELTGAMSSLPANVAKAQGQSSAEFPESAWKNLRIEQVYIQALPNSTATVKLQAVAPNGVRLCVNHAGLHVHAAGTKVGDSPQTSIDTEIQLKSSTQPDRSQGVGDEVCAEWQGTGSGEQLPLFANVPVGNLHISGSAVRVAGDDQRGDVFPSAIKSAKLTFSEIPGLKYAFDKDERLGFVDFKGQIRRLAVSKGLFELRATGQARSITRSLGGPEISIMPSRLTVLRAQYSEIWFAWGLLLYLVGLVSAFLAWRGNAV